MHRPFLIAALELAERRQGFCAPNPTVGAVLVHQNCIISSGYHKGAGGVHAEVDCLKGFEVVPEEAILYVTLEPCCHWGKTPPCTDLLIAKKVRHVVYGYRDPNPKVSGNGEKALSASGIRCEWFETNEISEFYRSYRYWTETHRPWVSVKLALSLDGVAPHSPMTGSESLSFTHRHRLISDALLTSAKTIANDDPQMNVRLGDRTVPKRVYVLDRSKKLSPTAQIFRTASAVGILSSGIESALEQLGRDGMHSVWVEVGPTLFREFVLGNWVHVCYLYFAPTVVVGSRAIDDATWLRLREFSSLRTYSAGHDWICEFQR